MRNLFASFLYVATTLVCLAFVIPLVVAVGTNVWPLVRSGGLGATIGLFLMTTALFNWAHARSRLGHCVWLHAANGLLVLMLGFLFLAAPEQSYGRLAGVGAVLVLSLEIVAPMLLTRMPGDNAPSS